MPCSSSPAPPVAHRPHAVRLWPLGSVLLLLLAAGCGTSSPPPEDVAGDRSCLPECFVGHLCCKGDCDGPTVPLTSSCCECLSGEVSSADCPSAKCGD
jgi:hypothetical protein